MLGDSEKKNGPVFQISSHHWPLSWAHGTLTYHISTSFWKIPPSSQYRPHFLHSAFMLQIQTMERTCYQHESQDKSKYEPKYEHISKAIPRWWSWCILFNSFCVKSSPDWQKHKSRVLNRTNKWTVPQASPTHGRWTPTGVGPGKR